MGAPWITIFAQIQAAFQAFMRPGVWFPFLRSLHCLKEKWIMPHVSGKTNMENILRGLMTVIQNDNSRSFWKVKKADPKFVQVLVFTKAEWLDVIEFSIDDSQVKVWSFSSGFIPLCIPFASFINLFLFWVPFSDCGLHKRRLDKIMEAMDIGVMRRSCNWRKWLALAP